VGLDHPDIYPLTLLAVILSVGKSSRFYQEFMRSGRAADMEADLAPPPWSAQDPDLMVVRAVASPGNSLAALEADVWAQVEILKSEGVKPEELARAKKLMKSQAVQALAKNFYRGLLVGLFHLKTGNGAKANLMLTNYEAVTLADIQRVAQTYLIEDNRTVVTLKPVTPAESQALGPLA
jgi:zinc protease